MNETETRAFRLDAFATQQGVSRRTIYNWIAAGLLTTRRTANSCVLVEVPSDFQSRPRYHIGRRDPRTQAGWQRWAESRA